MENDPESCLEQYPCKDIEKDQAELIGFFFISYLCDAINDFLADTRALYVSVIVSSLIMYDIEVNSHVAK